MDDKHRSLTYGYWRYGLSQQTAVAKYVFLTHEEAEKKAIDGPSVRSVELYKHDSDKTINET